MLYGSQQNCTEMLPCDRSHQLGEGQSITAEMPTYSHPSRLVYGSHLNVAAMLSSARSHQLGKGHPNHTAVSILNHPSRLVLESQRVSAEMPRVTRSQGKGRHRIAEMPSRVRSSQPVYGRVRRDPQQCHGDCTLPPVRKGHNLYAHQAATVSPFPINLWEDHKAVAEMPL